MPMIRATSLLDAPVEICEHFDLAAGEEIAPAKLRHVGFWRRVPSALPCLNGIAHRLSSSDSSIYYKCMLFYVCLGFNILTGTIR